MRKRNSLVIPFRKSLSIFFYRLGARAVKMVWMTGRVLVESL